MEQKFTLKLSGLTSEGDRALLNPAEMDKLDASNWRELTFTINNSVANKPAAFATFLIRPPSEKEPKLYLSTSGEEEALALNFFRTYKQSPFRLLLFSSLSLFERNGFHTFMSGDGVHDNGISHKKQVRQRIFSHVKVNGKINQYIHRIGEFPRVDFSQVRDVLAKNEPVPSRLLPPESILRKARAKSYAALKFEKLGKAKYRAMRKLRLAKK